MFKFALAIAIIGGTAAAQECNLQMLRGTYAVTYQGWLAVPQPGAPMPALLPGVIMGVLSISHNGSIRGGATVAVAGDKREYEATGGTVELKSGCAGTITLRMKVKGSTGPSSTEIDKFAYLPEDHEIRVIMDQLEMGAVPMVLGTWKRISPVTDMAAW